MVWRKFTKKKSKAIGKKIGIRLRGINLKEKQLRTLLKEKEVRLKEQKLGQEIKALKRERPTVLKKITKGTAKGFKVLGDVGGVILKSQTKKTKSSQKAIRRKQKETMARVDSDIDFILRA